MSANHDLWILWFKHGLILGVSILGVVCIAWLIWIAVVEIKERIWGIRVKEGLDNT